MARPGKDHRDGAAVTDQRRGDLRANEPASDHDEPGTSVRTRAHAPVVVERAEIDDAASPLGNHARTAAGREHEPLVGIPVASIIHRSASREIKADDPTTEPHVDRRLVVCAPNRAFVRVLPQPLGERWPLIGRMRFGGDQSNRSSGVMRADAPARGCSSHAAADDQIAVAAGRHLTRSAALLPSTRIHPYIDRDTSNRREH